MSRVGALSLAAAAPAAVGGLVFWAIHGHTTITRSIAYGFWFAAACLLVLMVVAGSKGVWRRTSLPAVEGWVFAASATLLTVAGAAIDAAGT